MTGQLRGEQARFGPSVGPRPRSTQEDDQQPQFTATKRFSRIRKTTTDNSGGFALSFKRQGLSLETVEKTGFVFEPCVTPKSWSRRYGPEQRDAPQRGRFLLYRVSGVDTSAVTTASTPAFTFATDGADYYLDLVSGRISTTATGTADLVFSIKQVGAATWLVTIRAADGGIWASANEMPYAPQRGCVSGFSSLYGQGYAISYRTQFDFFAKTQGGRHFSRIIVDIIKKQQTIQFHYVLSRTGNRFLFVPENVDNRGIHGPPHCKERYHCDFAQVLSALSHPLDVSGELRGLGDLLHFISPNAETWRQGSRIPERPRLVGSSSLFDSIRVQSKTVNSPFVRR